MQLAQQLFQGILALPEAYHMSVATEDIDKYVPGVLLSGS